MMGVGTYVEAGKEATLTNTNFRMEKIPWKKMVVPLESVEMIIQKRARRKRPVALFQQHKF
jgi:hypothetical protein